MVKTVKELADEMGVPKHIIHNLVAAMGLRDKMTKSGNRFLLDESQMAAIKKAFCEQTGGTPGEDEPAPSTDKPPEATSEQSIKPEAETEPKKATEPPHSLTISEWADNRQLRFNVINLEGELSKEKFAKSMLQRDFDIYRTQAEKTLSAKIEEYETSAAAKQAEYEETSTTKQAAYEKTLTANIEQLDRMTATLAKLAPYFGEQLEEIEKPPKRKPFSRVLDKFRGKKVIKL